MCWWFIPFNVNMFFEQIFKLRKGIKIINQNRFSEVPGFLEIINVVYFSYYLLPPFKTCQLTKLVNWQNLSTDKTCQLTELVNWQNLSTTCQLTKLVNWQNLSTDNTLYKEAIFVRKLAKILLTNQKLKKKHLTKDKHIWFYKKYGKKT